MFRHLRTRLTVLYAGLFGVALILISLAVYGAVSTNAERVTRQELVASGTVFDRLWLLRSQQLEDGAALLSRDFGFREAFATSDQATIQSALENLRQRLGIDLAFIVGVDGKITTSDGRSLGPAGAAVSNALQTQDTPSGVMMMDGRPYQAISAPILSPTLTGWVVFATKLDRREMGSLERLSAIPLDAVVVGRSGHVWAAPTTSALSEGDRKAVSEFVDRSAAAKGAPGTLVTSEGPAIALAKPLKSMTSGAPAVLLLRYPMARALAPYQALTGIIILTGLFGLVLMVAGSWALARSVTRPISALDDAVRRLQRGEAVTVEESGARDEISRLAQSFNSMAAEIGERERRITHLAMHDADTELPNRLALERRLAELVQGGAADLFVAAVGIDRFAHLRAAIGYEQTNAMVRDVGERLSRRLPRALIARLSGDVLALAFPARDRDEARAIAGQLASAMAEPVRLTKTTIDVGVTIGLSELSAGQGGAAAIERANIAVEQARGDRQAIGFFDAEAYGDPSANLSLMSEMVEGIAAGQLVLHHQPKHDIRKGRVTGVEALVRWRHPTRGFLSPDRFITLAEETGHIRALTEWVLAQAIEHQAAMKLAHRSLDMSVNISGRLLSDPEFADVALAMTAKAEGHICFEITETAVIENPELALTLIDRFSAAGVGISIDDYGTGLSSLAYLKKIKADELKIDKAFVLNVSDSQKDALLVRSTVDLAHSLGLKVTAEGVETDTAFALLAGMGCDIAQGFLIARPMPLKELLTFLHEDRPETRRYG